VRSTNVRETAERDVGAPSLDLAADGLRSALVAAGRDAREQSAEHDPREQIAVGEVLVALQPHLRGASHHGADEAGGTAVKFYELRDNLTLGHRRAPFVD
jgi:hypothetical protein